MIHALLTDKEEGAIPQGTPHLSYSRVNRYLHCPEQYRLYYVENLRPRLPHASLVFGQAVHQALAALFREGADPADFFKRVWGEVKDIDLAYKQKESWEKLRDTGQGLLEKFVEEGLPRLKNVEASEKKFELAITSLDLPFIGVIDLVADLEGKRTVVDFKTAAASYEEHEVQMSDQLTAYQLARPDAEQAALCVLVKTKEARIEWHFSGRTPDQLTEYLARAGLVGREIASGRFYKRPGMWCSWCDYLPVCLGDRKKVRETLIQIR